jgi:hypothetical protein
MERKMLLNLKARAEHAAARAERTGRRESGGQGDPDDHPKDVAATC